MKWLITRKSELRFIVGSKESVISNVISGDVLN
jgi:hypothetical protein